MNWFIFMGWTDGARRERQAWAFVDGLILGAIFAWVYNGLPARSHM